jgi:hypothetical protein
MSRRAFIPGWLAGLAALLAAGCVTTRAQFEPIGEELVAREDFTGGLAAWEMESSPSRAYERVQDKQGNYLRQFGSSGGAYLNGSLVQDFRMEFRVRLELPPGKEQTWAMINFRDFFNQRYCLILQPEGVSLNAARVRHSELKELRGVQTPLAMGRWYHFEVVAVGSALKVFKDGRLLLDLVDKTPIAQGGIWFENHARYSFTDVGVWRLRDFRRIAEPPAEQKAAAVPAARAKRSVALAEVENLGVAPNEVAVLADLLSSSLLATGSFRVVERKELRKVLDEMELQLSDLASPEQAARVGGLLNAEFLGTGSFGMLGGEYVLALKLIRVETGETVASLRRTFSEPSVIPLGLDELAGELARLRF